MFAILARNKEHVLPRYLACVSSLTYSKKQIHLYIRTNNNEDGTEAVLTSWLWEHSLEYASVDFLSYQDPVLMDDRSAPHHWVGNIRRLRALAKIREESLNTAREMGVDFYFVCDCDNFIIPRCLSDLISLGLPIAGPLLLSLTEGDPFANFFLREEEMKDGICIESNLQIISTTDPVPLEVEVVHGTYLVKMSCSEGIGYCFDVDRSVTIWEFICFSASARRASVPQVVERSRYYGYFLHPENQKEISRRDEAELVSWLRPQMDLLLERINKGFPFVGLKDKLVIHRLMTMA